MRAALRTRLGMGRAICTQGSARRYERLRGEHRLVVRKGRVAPVAFVNDPGWRPGPIAPGSPTIRAANPFDDHAASYARTWDADPTAQAMREQIWRQIRAEVRPSGAILDVGCGAGTDAAWMVEQGWRVVGLDASSGMVAEASRRAPGATIHHLPAERVGALEAEGPFDAALLNFGVPNVVDLRRVAAGLRRCLRPGARVFLVPMPRVNPAWMAGAIRRGRVGRAVQPAAGRRRPGRGWMGPDHLPERRGRPARRPGSASSPCEASGSSCPRRAAAPARGGCPGWPRSTPHSALPMRGGDRRPGLSTASGGPPAGAGLDLVARRRSRADPTRC